MKWKASEWAEWNLTRLKAPEKEMSTERPGIFMKTFKYKFKGLFEFEFWLRMNWVSGVWFENESQKRSAIFNVDMNSQST